MVNFDNRRFLLRKHETRRGNDAEMTSDADVDKRHKPASAAFGALKKSSQVKLLITNNAFCIVQRATAQSKTGFYRDSGVAEAPPGFQAGWSDCMYFSLSLFI
jgi:hypothetical protein